jgi:hypothetical protein
MRKTRSRTRKGQLVCQHLERVSYRILEEHREIIQEFVRKRHGVYALYRGERLYYVGLARNLSARLKQHLRDRHAGTWDRFSVYFTIGDERLKEMESLILRIGKPSGNRTQGGFLKSENLRDALRREIRKKQRSELDDLIEGRAQRTLKKDPDTRARRAREGRKPALQPYLAKILRLKTRQIQMTYKGQLHKARILRDGRIRYKGRTYASPSLAGKAVKRGLSCNGWYWWGDRGRSERTEPHDQPAQTRIQRRKTNGVDEFSTL